MRHQPTLLAIFTLMTTSTLIAGCRCMCGDDGTIIARVVQLVPVTEVSTGGGQAWNAAAQDASLGVGDALRTGAAGSATLEVIGQGAVKIGPNSLVRLGEVGQAQQEEREIRLVLETGEMEVETDYAGAPALVLAGPGGQSVRLGQGSRVVWGLDEAERLRIEVEEGTASVEHEGETTELGTGQSFSLGEAERLADEAAPDAGPTETTDAGLGDADGDAEEEPLEGLTVRLRGTAIELKRPGDESYSRARRARTKLEPGTGVRVTGRRPLELVGPDGASVELQPGSKSVFRGTGGGRIRVGLAGGSALARSDGAGVADLSMPGGNAETTPLGGSSAFTAKVRDRRRSKVKVTDGAAIVTTGGRREKLLTGAEVLLGGSALEVQRPRETPPVFNGSAAVYDPQRRGTFTIRFPAIEGCSTYAIHVDRNGSRHVHAVTDRPLLVIRNAEYGNYNWRAACLVDGEPNWAEKREGRVARRGDSSGRFKLPTKAPRTTLDSDGRTYTVTYQNRLPAISLRWSKAPEAPAYHLEVVNDRTGRKVYSRSSPRPARGFRSGFFQEGRYYWFFRAAGGSERAASPITSAQISFDNVAPAIQIIEPREGASASGTVRLRGVAAVGSKIVANGTPVELGGDYRFDQQVPVRGKLLLIRVVAPRRGTGYYIRHLNTQ